LTQESDLLEQINLKLSAMLAITIDQYLRSTAGLAKPRPRSIDRLLADVGLHPKVIGDLLGKSRQAVDQILAKDRSPSRKVSKDAATEPAG
jgi:hypothetical protein